MLGSVALFVPAISLKKMEKALTVPADAVYLDLEDSVAPPQKTEARKLLAGFLADRDAGGQSLLVRINPVGSDFWAADLAAVTAGRSIQALLLPNADLASVGVLADQLDRFDSPLKIVPLIETARGLEEAREAILVSSRVVGLQFGAEDYTASLGVRRTLAGDEIVFARARLANLARAYDLEMMDTPFTAVGEAEMLWRDCLRAREMGFTGKAVIHPDHIGVVRRAFQPSDEEVEKARRLLAAYEKQTGEQAGVFTLEGAMIDAPIIQRARDVLKKAGLAQ